MKRKRLSLEKEESIHRSIYRYTKVNSLSYKGLEPTLILDQMTFLPNSKMLDHHGKNFRVKTLELYSEASAKKKKSFVTSSLPDGLIF
jgi:hypothetical protein